VNISKVSTARIEFRSLSSISNIIYFAGIYK